MARPHSSGPACPVSLRETVYRPPQIQAGSQGGALDLPVCAEVREGVRAPRNPVRGRHCAGGGGAVRNAQAATQRPGRAERAARGCATAQAASQEPHLLGCHARARARRSGQRPLGSRVGARGSLSLDLVKEFGGLARRSWPRCSGQSAALRAWPGADAGRPSACGCACGCTLGALTGVTSAQGLRRHLRSALLGELQRPAGGLQRPARGLRQRAAASVRALPHATRPTLHSRPCRPCASCLVQRRAAGSVHAPPHARPCSSQPRPPAARSMPAALMQPQPCTP